MDSLVCPCSLAGRIKKTYPKKRFLYGPLRRACPLPYSGILAGIYNENVRQPSFVLVRCNSFAFIFLSGTLHRNIFKRLYMAMRKTSVLFLHDPFDMGFIGICPFISFHRVSLGADWIHSI